MGIPISDDVEIRELGLVKTRSGHCVYGAGQIQIWDQETYRLQHWDEQRIDITLNGGRLHGVTSSETGGRPSLASRRTLPTSPIRRSPATT